MALMDEFKEERERIIKNGTKKEKLAYFWEYYKWYVIIPTIIIVAVGSYIYRVLTAPEELLNGVALNTIGMESEELIADYCEERKIDTKEYSVGINTGVTYIANDESGTANYETSQALMAWVAAGTIDFIGGDLDSVTELANKEYFVDLTEVMTEEQIAKYEPYFLYVDDAPVLIDMTQCEAFAEGYGDSEQTLALGIAVNSTHSDAALDFIDYLMNE